ncbi:hypothetical protein QBC47DRAFT_384146 [Echria macrotheca]|uniref:ABM domain-containing protein n=1 Tax=Echria macrotheca TaxID=438768 RepID=A0AAJ0BA59_9PEZI|nr:hypothetical protein QBC47DRAFT_384146 [Echria macrotheca]
MTPRPGTSKQVPTCCEQSRSGLAPFKAWRTKRQRMFAWSGSKDLEDSACIQVCLETAYKSASSLLSVCCRSRMRFEQHKRTMNVTEFAFARLKTGDIEPALLEGFRKALNVQNDWHAANYSHLPCTIAERASFVFQQIEDPTRILITAKWESVESHWKWIQSEENLSVMASLGPYMVNESADDLDLSHCAGDFFGSVQDEVPGDSTTLVNSPVVAVERFFIDAEMEDAFKRKLDAPQTTPKAGVAFKGGWRIDVGTGQKQEYMLVSGWESVEKHMDFNEDLSNGARDLAAESTIKHYRRMV